MELCKLASYFARSRIHIGGGLFVVQGKEIFMIDYCYYEGHAVTPEMGSFCNHCGLYLETCMPVISNGCLMAAECDAFYCECCPASFKCMAGSLAGKEETV